MQHWNRLCREADEPQSLKVFKTKTEKAIAGPWQQQSLFEWEVGLHKPSEVPSNPCFYDSAHLSNISLLHTICLSKISSSLISPLFLRQYVISPRLDIWESEPWLNLYWDASAAKQMQRNTKSLVPAKKPGQLAGWQNEIHTPLVH